MSEHIKIIGGYVEINYERFAQLLPGKDERTLREELLNLNEDELTEKCEESYKEGYEKGVEDGEEKVHDFNDRIDRFLDKLLSDGTISKKQHDAICEGFPSE